MKKAELQLKVAEDSLSHTQQIHEKIKGLVRIFSFSELNVVGDHKRDRFDTRYSSGA